MDAGVLTAATVAPIGRTPPSAALRFRVVVSGLEIGRFSRCGGLGFDYDVTDYAEGGERAFTHALRGPVRHANLVLERGVTEEPALLSWLFAGHQAELRRTVTVFLLDDGGRPLRHWAFDGALPVRWQGPDLDSASSAVAIERLEIAHQGLVSSSPGAGALGGAPAPNFQRARLEIEGGGEVVCWLNPSEYTVTQSGAGPQELAVALVFDAADDPSRSVQDVCTALFAALEPAGEDGDRPPSLTFVWGDTPPFRARASRLAVRYVQFRPDGAPSRAWVDLALVRAEAARTGRRARLPGLVGDEDPAELAGGGRVHVVVAGDSLASIAHRSYGDATAWRAIAEANGIDDPTRLRTGTRLEVPPFAPEPAATPAPAASADLAGAGVAFPLHVDAAGGIALERGAADVRKGIELVLLTEPGERAMRPEFGCALHQFVFERVDAATLGRIRHEVLRAVERCEPRVEVVDVQCRVEDAARGTIAIELTYMLTGRTGTGRYVHELSVLPPEERADAA